MLITTLLRNLRFILLNILVKLTSEFCQSLIIFVIKISQRFGCHGEQLADLFKLIYLPARFFILSIKKLCNLLTVSRIYTLQSEKIEFSLHFIERKSCILHNLNIHHVNKVVPRILAILIAFTKR